MPDAPRVMRQLVAEAHPGVIVGAGTVLTAAEAHAALDAGARFFIAPNVGAAVAPFGGREARMGTNPMAWGVPRGAGQDPA